MGGIDNDLLRPRTLFAYPQRTAQREVEYGVLRPHPLTVQRGAGGEEWVTCAQSAVAYEALQLLATISLMICRSRLRPATRRFTFGFSSRSCRSSRSSFNATAATSFSIGKRLLADAMLAANLYYRVPRLRCPQHPQNLPFAVPTLPHIQALLSRSREPRQAANPQLQSGLFFGFWVSGIATSISRRRSRAVEMWEALSASAPAQGMLHAQADRTSREGTAEFGLQTRR